MVAYKRRNVPYDGGGVPQPFQYSPGNIRTQPVVGVHAARGLKRRRLAHVVEQSGKAQGKAWLYAVHRVKAVVKHVVLVVLGLLGHSPALGQLG